MKYIFITLSSLFLFIAYSQETSVTIDSCIQWTKRNYPLIKQREIYASQEQVNLKSINQNWLPKLSVQGQATFNTEVVKFNFPGMNINYPHDAYMVALNLEQNLYDGGQVKSQKNVEKLSSQINLQQNMIDLYRLVEQVNQLYSGILLGKENVKILELLESDLQNRLINMQVSVKNGLSLESSLSELEAEILKVKQNIIEADYSIKSMLENLSYLTNHTLTLSTQFDYTSIGGNEARIQIERPELKIFDLQSKMAEARYAQTNVQALPRLTIGATGNYGRPGPNFINQNLRFFGSANLSLHWNISSLYGLHHEKEKLNLNQNLIQIQKEAFLFGLKTTLNSHFSQLKAIEEMIASDNAIIEKREIVTKTAAAQMENGKLTVVNYLIQLNAELQAKLNKKVHEIKRMNVVSMINAASGSFKF